MSIQEYILMVFCGYMFNQFPVFLPNVYLIAEIGMIIKTVMYVFMGRLRVTVF